MDIASEEIEITQFDPHVLGKQPFTAIVSAKRNSGKSVLVRDLCYRVLASLYGHIFVMSDTSFSGFYQEFVPSKYVLDRFRPDVVEGILQRQRGMKGRTYLNSRVLIIIDDSTKADLNHPVLTKLFTQGRHFNVSVILSIQRSVSFVNPTIRANCDFAFILQQPSNKAQREVCEEYLDVFEGNDHMARAVAILRATTEDYGVCVKDNLVPSNQPERLIYYYKATKDLPEFMMGWKVKKIPTPS